MITLRSQALDPVDLGSTVQVTEDKQQVIARLSLVLALRLTLSTSTHMNWSIKNRCGHHASRRAATARHAEWCQAGFGFQDQTAFDGCPWRARRVHVGTSDARRCTTFTP